MTDEYSISISKDEINELPLYKFKGEIILIESSEDAINAAKKLSSESILGFDTETRPAFKKGEKYDISLLQLATLKKSYLFRLNKFIMPKEITKLLENPKIIKSGVAVRDDIIGLQRLRMFEANSFIDLAHIAKERKVKNFGLRALTAIFLKKRLSKKAKISNWEKEHLTLDQKKYAACDAVVGNEIYRAMNINKTTID